MTLSNDVSSCQSSKASKAIHSKHLGRLGDNSFAKNSAHDSAHGLEIHGPHFMSFGEFITKIIEAERCYSLSLSENRLLMKYANTLDRTKYRVNLEEIKLHKLETWATMCNVDKTNMSRTFRTLKELGIFVSVKIGVRTYYRFHDDFIQALRGQMVVKARLKLVRKDPRVDQKVDNSVESCHGRQQTVVTVDNNELSRLTTDSCHGRQLALIEEIPSQISLLPDSHPSSIPSRPAPVDNVDNLETRRSPLYRLGKICRKEDAEKFLYSVRSRDPKYVDSFLNYLGTQKVFHLNANQIAKVWVLWDEKQFMEQQVDFHDFGQQRPQYGVL